MAKNQETKVVIVGAGFGGLNAAKKLGNVQGVHVTVIDKRNHHLFQPLLYQVATAGISAEEIASPIRSVLSPYKNIDVALGEVTSIDTRANIVTTQFSQYTFDYLVLACGASQSYFGKDEWREFAPGMKNVEQAIEIRRKILLAFELAEQEVEPIKIEKLLTFVIVGGGPTGVELAGSLAEMTHETLGQDFRHLDLKKTKIYLIEAGPRLLAGFDPSHSEYAHEKLKEYGVIVKTNSKVTDLHFEQVQLDGEQIVNASTIIWAAGVQPSETGAMLDTSLDKIGRVVVEKSLNIQGKNHIFVIGDQANFAFEEGKPLPGLAPVAIQQGKHVAANILNLMHGKPLLPFHYYDKGQMATIGRGAAIAQTKNLKMKGFIAWLAWLFVHIMYLIGFRNKLLIVIRWAWLYFTFSRGARLIVNKGLSVTMEEKVRRTN